MVTDESVLRLENITKTYPGVVALKDVNLELRAGEVHALVGENGAGKSTLIKCCTGAVVPDSGTITVNNQHFDAMTPTRAVECGIGVIYQEFNLVEELSAAENIFLGNEIRNGIVVNKKAMATEAAKVFKELHINIDPNAPIKSLTVGYQQMVEIAKAVSKNSRILIMDEPSAVLTNAEVASLYEMVRKLKARGVTIVYISHRMDEIFELSDRITVMRDGVKVETLTTADTNVDELIKLMVGRELKETFPPRAVTVGDETILEVENLSGNGLRDVSFRLKKGEVLGFGGLIGSGRTELMELIFGVKRPDSGTIRLHGKPISAKTPWDAIKHGIALVPEDRKRQGAHLELQIDENISIAILKSISTRMVVNKKTEDSISERYRESLRIKTPSVKQKIKNLSGGNQQKVILAKWLATNPDLIIFDEPTRGIDVGAKYEIYKLMNALIEEGKTIIMISSEMEELIGMSDRILVLHDGRITGELGKTEFSQEAIMNLASGVA